MSPRPVLIVMPTLKRGGAERHSVWIATLLDPQVWTARVLAFEDGPWSAELAAAGIPVEVRSLPGGRHKIPAAAAAIRETVEFFEPVVISGHGVLVEIAMRIALRRSHVPSITWKHTYGHIGYRGMREKVFERVTGSSVTRYGAVCHTQVRYLTDELGLPADKISVVPNAVPVPAVCPAPAVVSHPSVLMVAAMRADKDHALVLRSWPAVLRERPDARLTLAGDGPCRDELEQLAAELGISDSVDFLGVRSDVDALLAQTQLLVLASYAVECFPYSVLEAMAAGRGVVSSNVAGLPEMVDDGVTGRLVPPRDGDALTRALLEGLSGDTAEKWGRAGWERSTNVYPISHWADRMSDVFTLVAGDSARTI